MGGKYRSPYTFQEIDNLLKNSASVEEAKNATAQSAQAAQTARDEALSAANQAEELLNTVTSESTKTIQAAQNAVEKAEEKVEEAKDLVTNPPKIQNGTWWVYNSYTDRYEDSGYDASLSFRVGTVTTGKPGSQAKVENVGTENDVVLDITIPQGATGAVENTVTNDQKGAPGGVATLDERSEVTPEQVPGYAVTIGDNAMGQKSNGTVLSIKNVCGNTVRDGIPAYYNPVTIETVENPLKLHISGKNLIDFSKAIKTGEAVGVSYSISDNGVISLSGICERPGSSAYIMPFGDGISKAFYLPSGTYYLSGLNTDYSESRDVYLYLNCYNKLGESVVDHKPSIYGPDGVEFAIPMGGAWITVNIAIKDGTDVTDVTITPQIEVGSEATEYEEPSNTIVEIPLIGKDGQPLEPLRMSYIGYVTTKAQNPDCIVLKNGVWYVKRTTAQLDLTNATWVKGPSYFSIRMNGKAIPGAQSKFVLCTHFPGSGEAPNSGGIWCGAGLALQNDAVPDYATNEWMAEFCAEQAQAGTPVTVVYSLSEPIYEELHQDVQNILNTLTVPIGACSVWFEGEVAPTADIGIPRGDFPSENARALAMTRADRTLSNLTDYQRALHNIGGRPNKDILVNSHFVGGGSQLKYGKLPINPRGKAIYQGKGHHLTNWFEEYDGDSVLELHVSGVIFKTKKQFSNFAQNIDLSPYEGKKMTLSFWLSEVSDGMFLQVYQSGNPQAAVVVPASNGISTLTFDVIPNSGITTVQVQYRNPDTGEYNSAKIYAAKLEEGDKQTLGWEDESGVHLFETPNFGEMLAQCQRYLLPLISNSCWGYADFPNLAYLQVPTPSTMRAAPVWSGTLTRLYPNDGNTVTNVYVLSLADNNIVLAVQGTGFVSGRGYSANEIVGFLSAEL